jgi:RNA polymerase sigma factor (sigma-70 family)
MDPVTWLRLVSKHLIAEVHRHHFRSKRSPDREQNYDEDCSDLLVNRIAQSMQSVGSVFNRVELLERVRGAMRQLSCNDREIIEMRHVDQMSIEEAAQFLEITFEAAKKRYQRALSRFRELTTHFK